MERRSGVLVIPQGLRPSAPLLGCLTTCVQIYKYVSRSDLARYDFSQNDCAPKSDVFVLFVNVSRV